MALPNMAQQQATRNIGLMAHQQPGQQQLANAIAAQNHPFMNFIGGSQMNAVNPVNPIFDQKRNQLSPEVTAQVSHSAEFSTARRADLNRASSTPSLVCHTISMAMVTHHKACRTPRWRRTSRAVPLPR